MLDKAADGSGYLETKATCTKEARSAKRRRLGLPVVALRRGISGVAWADSWLDVHREHGCDAAVDGGLFLALGPGRERLKNRPMTPSQLNFLVGELFAELGISHGAVRDFTSHGCKATTLSWCAKAFIGLEDRRILGGHSNLGDIMPLEYSRDALAGPLARLESVCNAIRFGHFHPDETRSDRWESQAVGKRGGAQERPQECGLLTTLVANEMDALGQSLNVQDEQSPSLDSSSEDVDNSDCAHADLEGSEALYDAKARRPLVGPQCQDEETSPCGR